LFYDGRKEINMEKPLAWFTEFSRWIAEAAGHPVTFTGLSGSPPTPQHGTIDIDIASYVARGRILRPQSLPPM
jgi:hypothetical protein